MQSSWSAGEVVRGKEWVLDCVFVEGETVER